MEKIFLDYMRTVAISGGIKAEASSLDFKTHKRFLKEGFTFEDEYVCWYKPTHPNGKAQEFNTLAFQAWKKSFREIFYKEARKGGYECVPILSLFANGKEMFERDGFSLRILEGHIISYSWKQATKGEAVMLKRLAEKSSKIDFR